MIQVIQSLVCLRRMYGCNFDPGKIVFHHFIRRILDFFWIFLGARAVLFYHANSGES